MNASDLIKGKPGLFFAKLPEAWRQTSEFTQEASAPESFAASYRATLSHPWQIPGLNLTFQRQDIYIDVPADKDADNGLRIVLRTDIDGGVMEFEGELQDATLLALKVRKPLDSLPGPLGEKHLVSTWMEVLPLQAQIDFELTFVAIEKGMLLHHTGLIQLTQAFGIDGTSLKLTEPGLRLQAVYNLAQPQLRPSIAGSLLGKINIEKTVFAQVDLSPGGLATLRLQGNEDAGLPGPADMLKAVGFKKEGEQLAASISQVPLFGDLYLDALSLDFNLKTRKFLGGALFGHVAVSGHKVRFEASYPDIRLAARLDPETPIKLGELIQAAYPDQAGIPSTLTVSRASIQMNAQPLSFRMGITVADIWKTKLGPVETEFQSLSLNLEITKNAPVTGRLAAILKIGEVDFSVMGERIASGDKTGWHFRSALAVIAPIRITELLPSLAQMFDLPEPDHVPDIDLSGITLELNTLTKSCKLSARAELKEKLGVFDSAFVSFDLSIDKSNKDKSLSIKLNGLLLIEKSKVEFATDLGHPDWKLQATWEKAEGESLHIYDLIKIVSPGTDTQEISDPVKRVLSLNRVGFSYQHTSRSLDLEARNEAGIALKLNLFKGDKGAGAVLGLQYEQPHDMPEFGHYLAGGEQGLRLLDAWLIFSWVPADSEKPAPKESGTQWPVAVNEMGTGLILFANLDLSANQKGGLGNLGNALPDKTAPLAVRAQIDVKQKSMTMGVSLKKDLSFTTKDSHPFVVKECGIALSFSPKGFRIHANGRLEFTIDNHPVHSLISLDLTQEHIRITGSAEDQKGITLFGLNNVKLYSLGLLLGIDFEPPAVELGLEGEMTFRRNQTQKEYFGIVLMFTEPVPVPEYFALDISRLSLSELLRNVGDSQVTSRNFISDDLAKIEALSLFYAAKDITLPSGASVKPGLGFQGKFTILNWGSWLEFKASEQGVTATGQFEVIDYDGFKMVGNTKDVLHQFAQEGSQWLPVSNTKRLKEGAVTRQLPILKGGGARLHFSTLKAPYLQTDFDIHILDVIQAKAGILINDSGLDCDVVVHVPNLYDLDLKCNVKHVGKLGAATGVSLYSKGDFTAGPNVELPFSLKFPFTGHDKVGLFVYGHQEVRSGKDVPFLLKYSFDFKIIGKTIPGVTLDIDDPKLDFKSIMDMALENFWANGVVNLCRLILPDFLHGVCDLLKLPKAGALPPTHMPWMDEAYRMTQGGRPMLLKSGQPAKAYMRLIEDAEQQTNDEIELMQAVHEELASVEGDVIRQGGKRLIREIAIMEREIRDLSDQDHMLENAVIEVWNQHLPGYRTLSEQQFFHTNEYYLRGAAKSALNTAQEELVEYQKKIKKAVMHLAVDPMQPKGYSEAASKYARVAVEHFYEVVAIRMQAGVENELIAKAKLARSSFPGLKALKASKPKVICIKQEETP